MKNDKVKTNAMRILDSNKIEYIHHSYDNTDGQIDGVSVSQKIGIPPEKVFKTLVTIGNSKNYIVFVIPVDKELNLKKCALASGEKSVEMIKVSQINSVTGYIRGGCSPIGMKKEYKTIIDESVNFLDTFCFSAGKIGHQIELKPADLKRVLKFTTANLTL